METEKHHNGNMHSVSTRGLFKEVVARESLNGKNEKNYIGYFTSIIFGQGDTGARLQSVTGQISLECFVYTGLCVTLGFRGSLV